MDRYYLPEDDVKPQEKYVEDATERGPNYEQKRWEEEHFHAGTLRFGARDASEKSKKAAKTYDVIMDDEIEFVQALKMPGTMKDKEKDKVGDHHHHHNNSSNNNKHDADDNNDSHDNS